MWGGLGPELVPRDDGGQLLWISVGFAVDLEPVIGYLAEDDFFPPYRSSLFAGHE